MKRYLFCLVVFSAIFSAATLASAQINERSDPFEKSVELQSGEQGFGTSNFISGNKKLLQELESYSSSERTVELTQLLSLEEFRQSQLILAQNLLQDAIENEPNTSVKRSEALLLSAIELLSSSPLKLKEIEEAGKKIKQIPTQTFADVPVINAEYKFWLAEILRSEHDISGALEYYSDALRIDDNSSFNALLRFRRAELYEHELRYLVAASDFDTIASHSGNALRLYASLRRASLLRSMGKYSELLSEVSRASSLASDTAHLRIPDYVRDLGYYSPLENIRRTPYMKRERLFSKNSSLDWQQDTLMLSSHYTQAEILLLKGTAYSGLKQYDSAEFCFERGEKFIDALNDSIFRPETLFLTHALKFEHGWIKLSEGENQKAADIFFALAKEDTASHTNPLFTGGTTDNTGAFYHEEKPSLSGTKSINAFDEPETSRFIYDDFPARARFYAGIALSRAGKVIQARDVLTDLSQDPSAIYADMARYHLALVEFKSGRTLQAEGLLAPIAMRRSQSGVFASILLGDLHYRRSSFAKAAEYFAFALANLPDNDTALRSISALERGLSLLPLGSWNESAQDLKLYVSLAVNETQGLDEALFWLGRAYFRSDSIPQARNCFRRVLDEFPNSSRLIDAQYGYAWTLFRNGEYKSADREFAKVIEMDSITRYAYDALSRRGDALYAGGDLKKAVAIYNLAVDRPTFNEYRTTRSLYQLGVIRMRSDSAHSAMNAFHTIIAKFPKSDILDRAYYNYAVAGFAIKQNEKAGEAVKTLAVKFKDSPYATKGLYLAASEEEHSGDLKSAFASYKKIIYTYPSSQEFVPSLFGALNSLTQLKKYDEAVALSDSFMMKSPNASYVPKLLFRKGEIQLLASNPKNAEQTFENFSDRFPSDTLLPMARYLLGKAVSVGDKAKGYSFYEEVTGKYPHSNAAPYAYLAMARSEKGNKEKAAEHYSKAFDMEYYSSDVAPVAMLEYAGFVRSEFGADSALVVFNSITDRYLIETSVGGKAQLEVAEILLTQSQKNEAIIKFQKLADAQEGYELAAESRLRLGQLYKREGVTKKALTEFDHARDDNNTTKDQLGRSYLGSAECHIAQGDKKTARQILGELLVTSGIPKSRRDAARELLVSITPKKKIKKHK